MIVQVMEDKLGQNCRYTYFVNPGPLASIPGVCHNYCRSCWCITCTQCQHFAAVLSALTAYCPHTIVAVTNLHSRLVVLLGCDYGAAYTA